MVMAYLSHQDCLLHVMGKNHPEQPERIRAIEDELIRTGLMATMKAYDVPMATREQLVRAHDENYVDSLFKRAPKTGLIALDPDTWMNPYTLTAALRAAGAVVKAVDLVMSHEVNEAFCNVRPPGHHAEHAQAMGFCFFNNVAVGAAHALAQYNIQRIAIIDFDVHHGNGTEDIFRHEKRVLYCSSFQSPFYPFSGADTVSHHILNVPLPASTSGKRFRERATEAWFPALVKFNPDFIFFSAGFDAYIHDPLAELLFQEEDYGWITHEIKLLAKELCHGRIVSVLEGGYDLSGLGRCAAAHIRALQGM